jgi:hypothetical protein
MRYEFAWGSPEKCDVLVLQGHLSKFLYHSLSGITYRDLDLEKRIIYLHPRFLVSLVRNLPRVSRLAAAVSAVAECSKARVLIGMDNFDLSQHSQGGETLFAELARANQKLAILSVQHGQELRRSPLGRSRKRVTLLCWGRWAADHFPKMGRTEDRFVPVGPLVDSLYREARPSAIDKDVDVCFISTVKGPEWWGAVIAERREGYEKLTQYLRRFASRHQVAPHIAMTIDRDQNQEIEVEYERRWFLERLGSSIGFTEPRLMFGTTGSPDVSCREPSHVKERYSTYYLCDRSQVTLGMTSSVLWESFGRGNKTLAVNLTDNEIYDFPIPGIWSMRQPSYEAFESRLLELLHMGDDDWMRISGESREYLMHYDLQCPPYRAINAEVRRCLMFRN